MISLEVTLAIFVALIALSAFFSGVEIAFFSLAPGRVRSMVRRKLPYASVVERLKSNPNRLLVTILIGNNIVNISAASIATKIALDYFGSFGVGVATGVVTLAVLIFGEIVPKSFAQSHAASASRWSAPFLLAVEVILWPVVSLFEKFVELVHAFFPKKRRAQVSEEEIRSMMYLGEEEGSLERHERQFVERLFRFNDLPISSVMMPIERVAMLNGSEVIRRVAGPATESGYSRFPVYQRSKDVIIGHVHLKDIARAIHVGRGEETLREIVSPALRVRADMHLDDAFRLMQSGHQHVCLVEEGGRVVGIVTLEDIIEELLGEIHDESDFRKKRAH